MDRVEIVDLDNNVHTGGVLKTAIRDRVGRMYIELITGRQVRVDKENYLRALLVLL